MKHYLLEKNGSILNLNLWEFIEVYYDTYGKHPTGLLQLFCRFWRRVELMKYDIFHIFNKIMKKV